jgi:phosphatidylglycerophosphatase A
MDRIKKLLVTGLGTGYLPLAPGSWGSAAVTGVFLAVGWLTCGNAYWLGGVMLAIAAAAGLACVALGEFAERALGGKDPDRCTIDEFAGQAITYLLLPTGGGPHDWLVVAGVGFLAFRALDVIKPPPANTFEKLSAGWGVLMDDVVAGVYANILCQLLLRFWLLKAG